MYFAVVDPKEGLGAMVPLNWKYFLWQKTVLRSFPHEEGNEIGLFVKKVTGERYIARTNQPRRAIER